MPTNSKIPAVVEHAGILLSYKIQIKALRPSISVRQRKRKKRSRSHRVCGREKLGGDDPFDKRQIIANNRDEVAFSV